MIKESTLHLLDALRLSKPFTRFREMAVIEAFVIFQLQKEDIDIIAQDASSTAIDTNQKVMKYEKIIQSNPEILSYFNNCLLAYSTLSYEGILDRINRIEKKLWKIYNNANIEQIEDR